MTPKMRSLVSGEEGCSEGSAAWSDGDCGNNEHADSNSNVAKTHCITAMTDAKGHQLQGYWKRMEILFLDQFSVMGGAQICLLDVLDAVEKRDWHAHVALPGDGPLAEQVRSRGLAVDKIPCGPYRSGSKSLGDFFQLP